MTKVRKNRLEKRGDTMKRLYSGNSGKIILLRNFILGLGIAIIYGAIMAYGHDFSMSNTFFNFLDPFVFFSIADFAKNKTNNKFLQTLLVFIAGIIMMIGIFFAGIIFHF